MRGMEGEKKREKGEGGVGWIKRREKQRKVEGKGEMKWRDRRKERKTRERERERVRKIYGMEGEWKRRRGGDQSVASLWCLCWMSVNLALQSAFVFSRP